MTRQPRWCDLDCRLALYPGQDPADLAARVEAAVAEACAADPFLRDNPAEVGRTGFHTRGYHLAPGSDAEATLATAHEAATGGDEYKLAPGARRFEIGNYNFAGAVAAEAGGVSLSALARAAWEGERERAAR